MEKIRAGFAMCASFCTFSKALTEMESLINQNVDVTPIMSQNAYSIDTRFGKADEFVERIENLCGKKIIHTITEAEPIGPKKLLDILIIEPCTGNTLGKLANGITDTAVTLSAKSHLRNSRPLLLAVSTNDALASSAKNIGQLMNYKNIFFVPMAQDDCVNKPNSIVADFSKTYDAMTFALAGKQLQPLYTK
ncbi:Dipicolinate synthase subunit B [bioreactor metagenome]|uniref:Dipicolinate synthase subunit B n=1 Tax=bioreactor metagenome TaxID=1076179 RepID=A0A645CS55_9ZZZZ